MKLSGRSVEIRCYAAKLNAYLRATWTVSTSAAFLRFLSLLSKSELRIPSDQNQSPGDFAGTLCPKILPSKLA